MDARGLESLLAVVLVAALAPAIVSALPGPKIPQVVIMIFGGVLIGPHVLGLADTGSIQLLSNIGLGFLFLLAGYELDPQLFRDQTGRLAMLGWAVSALLSVAAVALLAAFGLVRDFVPIGLALTTTALGTLLPILQDNDMLSGKFGRYVLAAGAVGELFPIIAISLFLTKRNQFIAIGSLLAVALAALLLTAAPRAMGDRRLRELIKQGQRATAQTTLRWSIVLLVLLLVVAERFGLDVILGAVLAGMVLRSWTHRMEVDVEPLESKLEAVGYGIFIPLFFVASGMTLDVQAILADPLRLLVFAGLLIVVRGLPSLLVYARLLPLRQRVEMTFITATTMPLLIALAEIGLRDGVMLPSNAAALVGAGVVSVLVYPAIAAAINRRGKVQRGVRQPLTGPAEDAAEMELASALPIQLEQVRRSRQSRARAVDQQRSSWFGLEGAGPHIASGFERVAKHCDECVWPVDLHVVVCVRDEVQASGSDQRAFWARRPRRPPDHDRPSRGDPRLAAPVLLATA